MFRGITRSALLGVSLLSLAMTIGCSPTVPKNAVVYNGRIVTRTPMAVYPTADHVILFAGKSEAAPTFRPAAGVKGIRLTPEQRRQFDLAFTTLHDYGKAKNVPDQEPEEVAACFDPHHFFRYYDKADHLVGEIQVCLCCGGIYATPNFYPKVSGKDYNDWDRRAIEGLLKSMDVPTTAYCETPGGA